MPLYRNSVLVICAATELTQYISNILTTQGYIISVAQTGKEGLLKIQPHIDLILLDRVLPDYDGLKLCHLFKMDKSTKHIPIIILSDHPRLSDKIESFHLGADDYLRKPLDWDDLLIRVEASILRSQVTHKIHEQANFEMLNELHEIVDRENIIPFFQPIYKLHAPLRLYGLEVLSRPQTSGVLSNPEALFKVAHRYGCYYKLEMIVWKKALEVAEKIFAAEHLFLNCSPYLIGSKDANGVKEIFNNFNLDKHHVFLEITERSAISVYEKFLKQVAQFRLQGFKIAVDDVGAGYSSLDVIAQTRPDVVKIDRHIINGSSIDHYKRSLVRLIVEFCIENGIICIAEGVENKEDLNTVMNLGVQFGQGYYFKKPSSNVDMQELRTLVV